MLSIFICCTIAAVRPRRRIVSHDIPHQHFMHVSRLILICPHNENTSKSIFSHGLGAKFSYCISSSSEVFTHHFMLRGKLCGSRVCHCTICIWLSSLCQTRNKHFACRREAKWNQQIAFQFESLLVPPPTSPLPHGRKRAKIPCLEDEGYHC